MEEKIIISERHHYIIIEVPYPVPTSTWPWEATVPGQRWQESSAADQPEVQAEKLLAAMVDDYPWPSVAAQPQLQPQQPQRHEQHHAQTTGPTAPTQLTAPRRHVGMNFLLALFLVFGAGTQFTAEVIAHRHRQWEPTPRTRVDLGVETLNSNIVQSNPLDIDATGPGVRDAHKSHMHSTELRPGVRDAHKSHMHYTKLLPSVWGARFLQEAAGELTGSPKPHQGQQGPSMQLDRGSSFWRLFLGTVLLLAFDLGMCIFGVAFYRGKRAR